jgi:spore coat protein U-like protein
MMKRLLLIALLLGVPALLHAGVYTAEFPVSATVPSYCRITSTNGISFGNYNPLDTDPLDADGSISFRCVQGTTYWVYIAGQRSMTDGQNHSLNFSLYSDSNRSQEFPSAKTGQGQQASSYNTVTVNVYGRIAAEQDVPVGSYSRTLEATVEY